LLGRHKKSVDSQWYAMRGKKEHKSCLNYHFIRFVSSLPSFFKNFSKRKDKASRFESVFKRRLSTSLLQFFFGFPMRLSQVDTLLQSFIVMRWINEYLKDWGEIFRNDKTKGIFRCQSTSKKCFPCQSESFWNSWWNLFKTLLSTK
jgi:hypothetical protein